MKKKLSYLLLIVMCCLMASPVYATKSILGCDNFLTKGEHELLIDAKIADTVHIIFLVIQIVVPVVLVVFGMIDLIKAVIAGKEDEIKKNQMTFVKRLIAAAIVFFVFVIVKLLISFVADSGKSKDMINCVNCFINGTGDTCATQED